MSPTEPKANGNKGEKVHQTQRLVNSGLWHKRFK